MANVIRRISISLKIVLGFLFSVLFIAECLDGFHGVSDWAVSLFAVIMLNDVYIHLRLYRGGEIKCWTLSERIDSRLSNKKRYISYILNILFFIMIAASVLMESLILSQELKDTLYKVGTIIWSGVFLISNLCNLKEDFRISRFVVTNVAFIFLVGSLTLI